MQIDLNSLLTAVVASAAAILASIVANAPRRADRQALQRQDNLNYYRESLKWLITLRGKLQFLHFLSGKNEKNEEMKRERETAYGEAYGILLSLGELQFITLAEQVISPANMPPKKSRQSTRPL
jgi:hypothetical protein